MNNSFALLSIVHFRKLDKWYVEYFLNDKRLSSSYDMELLKTLIRPIKRRIKKNNYDGTLPIVSKIIFKSGEIVFRKENTTGMDLLQVKKGDLLVSSINFHQGAVAYNNICDFVCSTHYQTFEINIKKIIPEYLILTLRSPRFIELVTGIKANGIKNESGFDFIGNFEIPLPSISDQQRILNAYYMKLDEAEENIKKGDSYNDGLLLSIQEDVADLKDDIQKKTVPSSMVQIVPFADMSRWEVSYILKESRLEKIYKSYKYPIYSIAQLQKGVLFGVSLKASSIQKDGMIPMLRMPNIVNGEIDCSQLKYLPKSKVTSTKESDKWLLRKGDFLINRTNSKELVGKAAVFDLDGVYTYASYVIRYRFDTNLVLPEYVNIVFMLPIVRKQIDTFSRQTAGQCNINSDEIGSIRIPVPPISIQKDIIKKYNDAKNGAKMYYDYATKCRADALIEFEKEIFS